MSVIAYALPVGTNLGAHGHVFSSGRQFETLYKLLTGEVGEVVDHTEDVDVLISDDKISQKTTMFWRRQGGGASLGMGNGIYHSDLRVGHLYYTSIADRTIQF